MFKKNVPNFHVDVAKVDPDVAHVHIHVARVVSACCIFYRELNVSNKMRHMCCGGFSPYFWMVFKQIFDVANNVFQCCRG
jgi:hypothetical protein